MRSQLLLGHSSVGPDGYPVLKDVFQGEQDPVDLFLTPQQEFVYFFKQPKQLSTVSDAGANKNFGRRTRSGNRWKVDKARTDLKGTSGSRTSVTCRQIWSGLACTSRLQG